MTLLRPFAFWRSSPPPFKFTAVLWARDGRGILTGDEQGAVARWKRKNEEGDWSAENTELVAISTGINSAVIAITEVASISSAACVLYRSGALSILDLQDLRCTAHRELPKAKPTCCTTLPGHRHVAVACEDGVHVLSVPGLRPLAKLCLPHVVSALPRGIRDAADGRKTGYSFCSLSTEKYLQFWSGLQLQTGDLKGCKCQNVLVEIPGEPIGVDQTPNSELILAVTTKGWALYFFKSPSPAKEWLTTGHVPLTGGEFVSERVFVIRDAAGVVTAFEVSKEHFAMAREYKLENDEYVFSGTQTGPSAASVSQQSKGRTKIEDKLEGAFSKASGLFKKTIAKAKPGSASSAAMAGSVGKGHPIPNAPIYDAQGELREMENAHVLSDGAPVPPVEPAILFTTPASVLNEKWGPADGAHPASCTGAYHAVMAAGSSIAVFGGLEDRYKFLNELSLADVWPVFQNNTEVLQATATCWVIDLGCSMNGHADGNITVPGVSKKWRAHVTSITAVHIHDAWGLSGCNAGVVRVWPMNDLPNCAAEFFHHSGAVQSFKTLPESIKRRIACHVCSIGADSSVVFYNLLSMTVVGLFGGHSAPIQEVQWNTALDIAYVVCGDGSVSVWHISTSTFDRRLTGEEASTILNLPVAPQPAAMPQVAGAAGTSRRVGAGQLLSTQVLFNDYKREDGTACEVPMVTVDIEMLLDTITAEISAQPNTAEIMSFSNGVATALSYLLDGDDHEYLQKLRTKFGLTGSSDSTPSFCLCSSGRLVSVLCPGARGESLFAISQDVTAVKTLFVLTVIQALSVFDSQSPVYKDCTYYYSQLVRDFPNYRPPSFTTLFSFFLDATNPLLRQSAEKLLNTTVSKYSEDEIIALGGQLRSKRSIEAALGIATLCAQRKETIGTLIPVFFEDAAKELLLIVKSGAKDVGGEGYRNHACSLLGQNYTLWRTYIIDGEVIELMKILYQRIVLDLRKLREDMLFEVRDAKEKDAGRDAKETKEQREAREAEEAKEARKRERECSRVNKETLAFLAEYYAPELLDILESNFAKRNVDLSVPVLVILAFSVRANPTAFLPVLPRIVNILLKGLDGNFPSLREAILDECKNLLKGLMNCYSVVAFNSPKHTLAIGESSGQVHVYDLRRGQASATCNAFEKPVTAVALSSKADLLATYCNSLGVLKVWQLETQGGSGLWGSHSPKVVNTFTVSGVVLLNPRPNQVRLAFDDAGVVTLIGVGSAPVTFVVKG